MVGSIPIQSPRPHFLFDSGQVCSHTWTHTAHGKRFSVDFRATQEGTSSQLQHTATATKDTLYHENVFVQLIKNPHLWLFHLKARPCYREAAKSVQLAAINCALAHLFAAMHPSIILTLPAVSWFHLSDSFSCACVSCVCGLCRCVKLTLHQSPALGALPHFTRPLVPCAPNDKSCIEPTLSDRDGGNTAKLKYYYLWGLPLKRD